MRSYKRVFLVLLFVLCTSGLWASIDQLGVTAGMSSSRLRDDNQLLLRSSTGFTAGGFVRLGLFEYDQRLSLSFRPELRLSQKGASWGELSDPMDIRFTYIDVPLLLQLELESDPQIRPYLLFGPDLSVLLGASALQSGTPMDIRQNMKPLDVGLVVSAGVATNGSFDLGLEYSWGLIRQSIADGAPTLFMNRVLSLIASYSFL